MVPYLREVDAFDCDFCEKQVYLSLSELNPPLINSYLNISILINH